MPPKTLVSALDEARPAKRPRRQLNRRDTDAAVDRIIQEHFSTLTKQETDLITHEGMALRQTLKAAKRDAKDSGKRITGASYQRLREVYAIPRPGDEALQVQNSNETLQRALIEAVAIANSANPAKRSKQPLYNFFASCSDLNQKEIVGLLKSIESLNVVASAANRKHVLEVLKFLVNSELYNKHKKEVDRLRDLWDECLAHTFLFMKKERMPLATWWQNFKDYVAILGDVSDFQAIMDEEQGWCNVYEPLLRVTTRSQLGMKLFGNAFDKVSSERFSASLDAELVKLAQHQEAITAETVRNLKESFVQLGDGTLANLGDKFEKRMVTVAYRSVSLAVEVMDFREEIEVKVSALLKQLSVGLLNGIPAMVFEDAFLGDVSLVNCRVEPSLLKPFIAARQAANDLLIAGDYERGADMLSALQAKLAVFVHLDRTFVMEVALTKSMCSDGGISRLQGLTLDLLPTIDKRVTVHCVAAAMAEMQRGKLYSMMNNDSRHIFDACKEMVNYLERGLPVKILACEASDFVKAFRSRLEFFLTHTKKVGEENKLFVGKAALAEIYTEVLGGGKVPTELGQLDSLGTFSFLLGATEKTALDNATKALVGAGSRRGATSASSSGGARAEKAKVSKKGSRKDDDIASAAALLGM